MKKRLLVDEAHQRCHELLQTHWDKMVVLSNRLLEVETVNAPEFEALMRRRRTRRAKSTGQKTAHPWPQVGRADT